MLKFECTRSLTLPVLGVLEVLSILPETTNSTQMKLILKLVIVHRIRDTALIDIGMNVFNPI